MSESVIHDEAAKQMWKLFSKAARFVFKILAVSSMKCSAVGHDPHWQYTFSSCLQCVCTSKLHVPKFLCLLFNVLGEALDAESSNCLHAEIGQFELQILSTPEPLRVSSVSRF